MQERQRSWSAVRDWTSCRIQASFHALSVPLEWAATASSAMAACTGCTRNAVGSSAWKRTLTIDVHGARELHAPWMADHRSPGRTWQAWGGSFLLLPRRHALSSRWLWTFNHNTCENRLEEVQGSATSPLFTPPLFQNTWPALVCGAQCSMPARLGHWQSWISSICSEMTGQWSDRSAMSGRKTLSPPGPMSYLCSLALRIWTSFWRREDFDGMDMWNAPVVQSRQPLIYRLMESVGLGGPKWHGSSWQRGIAECGRSRLSTLMIDVPGDLVRDLPCVQQASYLEGGPLMWTGLLVAHFENIGFYVGSSYSKYRLFTGFSIKNIG